MLRFKNWLVLLPVLVGVAIGGCAKETPAPTDTKVSAGHSHDGWWCSEHGVPEEECALCNSKLAADFQKKGDWCKEHQRPDSQCFVCHPELEAKFAARYEAKYGEPPPKPGAEPHEHGKEEGHKHDEPKS